MFVRGQDVAYIGGVDDGWRGRVIRWFHPEPGSDLVKGQVYRIIGFTPSDSVLLADVDNSGDDYWDDGFDERCFRPVAARKTDIAIFTKMLTTKKGRVNA